MNPVETTDLSYSIDGNLILDGIDLTIEQGDFVGLIGPNGGGKTTLLQILLGLTGGWTGQVKVFGRSPDQMGGDRHLIGYVPQLSHYAKGYPATAHDVVLMGTVPTRGLLKRLGEDDRKTADKMVELVGMAEHSDRLVGDLSGGQRQRIMVARALAAQPKMLILDEPTTGVDLAAENSFYDLLAELRSEMGLTIIMASHDLTMVSQHASTVACLNRGMHCHSSPDELDHGKIAELFGAHVEFLIHGDVPHRVVRRHEHGSDAGAEEGSE